MRTTRTGDKAAFLAWCEERARDRETAAVHSTTMYKRREQKAEARGIRLVMRAVEDWEITPDDNLSRAEGHVAKAHKLLDKMEDGIRTGDTDAGWRAGPDAEPPRVGVV